MWNTFTAARVGLSGVQQTKYTGILGTVLPSWKSFLQAHCNEPYTHTRTQTHTLQLSLDLSFRFRSLTLGRNPGSDIADCVAWEGTFFCHL